MRLERWLYQLSHRIRVLFHPNRVEQELEEEFKYHLELKTEEGLQRGLALEAARKAAVSSLDGISRPKEQVRDTIGLTAIEQIGQDLRFGVRMLRKSPGFALTALVSLGFGIGANTAIFGLVKQVILDSLPVRDPQSLVRLTRRTFEQPSLPSFSFPFLKDLQAAEGIPFEGFLATTGLGQVTMATEAGAEPVAASAVSGNYYELLGVRPALGRLLTAEDDRVVGANPVAVLSYNFWNRRFGRDPSVLNKTIRLDGRVFTVIGVSAAGFDGLSPGQANDVEIPITMSPYPSGQILNRGDWWLDVFGRLRAGAGAKDAGDLLLPLLLRNYELAGRMPRNDYERRVRESERMQTTPAMRGTGAPRAWERALWVLTAMVAAVLLLACINIASLLLARGWARGREYSVRTAIGAGRGRLIRQQLTESLLLAALGGVLGLVIAYGLSQMLVAIMVSDRAHSTLKVTPDWWVLTFNFVVTVAAGLLFGLVPAIRASRLSLMDGLKGVLGNGIGRLAGRKILISAQIAVSVVLLMGAGLFVRTLISFRNLNLGFRADRLLEFGLDPAGYPPDQIFQFYEQVRERLAVLPGVSASAVGRQRLMGGGQWGSGISVEGFVVPEGEDDPRRDGVSAGYFSALGIPLVAGREFEETDRAQSMKVAIVNETFARHYFGRENPIGKRIGEGGHAPERTVVGVVRDAKYARLREEPMRFWWVPYKQLDPERFHALTLYVRTTGDPAEMIQSVRQVVASVDNRVALFTIRTMQAQLNENLKIERLLATLSLFFGGLAALLAAIGLFGVLAYSVARREREIGIRVALGASSFQASWTVIRDMTGFALLGLAVGLGLAASAGKVVEGFLFGVHANDVASLAAACGVMGVIAVFAALIPARRAAAVPPAVACRVE